MQENRSIYRLLGATSDFLQEAAATRILPWHKSLASSFADDFDAEAIRRPRLNSDSSTDVRGLRYAPALLDAGDGDIENSSLPSERLSRLRAGLGFMRKPSGRSRFFHGSRPVNA